MRTKVAREWIRGPADELAIERDCTFDEAAGRFACDFVEKFCRQSKGRWAGQRIELIPWQRDLCMRLYGWKRPDGTRRYRKAYCEIAKKNGKSTLVSALSLNGILADGEGAPEVYLNAVDKDQASIIYSEAARMVRASPDLSARLDVVESEKRILDPKGNGAIITNSSIAASKDGLNPHYTIFDELHRQQGRELYDVFEYASVARTQPVHLDITTAGEAPDGVWYEQREYSERVNAGEVEDLGQLGVIYRALESDDIEDPATWRKANPSLGYTITAEGFAEDLKKAKRTPAELSNFLRLRLNIVCRGENKFLDPKQWAACGGSKRTDLELRGRPCFAGLDLSSTTDLTALVALFGDADDGFELLCEFWLPEDDILALERRDKVPYRAWADRGFLTLTPGNVIDYGFIRRSVNELAAEHNLEKLLVDPYNATKLAGELRDADGLPVEYIRQGFLSLSAPTKELSRLILSGKIRHDDNPILAWHARNAVAETDAAGNIKLSKNRSRLKIDGMSALVNGLAGAIAGDSDGGGSVYERRGLLRF